MYWLSGLLNPDGKEDRKGSKGVRKAVGEGKEVATRTGRHIVEFDSEFVFPCIAGDSVHRRAAGIRRGDGGVHG